MVCTQAVAIQYNLDLVCGATVPGNRSIQSIEWHCHIYT